MNDVIFRAIDELYEREERVLLDAILRDPLFEVFLKENYSLITISNRGDITKRLIRNDTDTVVASYVISTPIISDDEEE
jgi:hypothetical protein